MIKAILFDAFGTLVEISDKRNPFKRAGATREAMRQNLGLDHYTEDRAIHRDLCAELQSIRLFDDVIPTLRRLREHGLKIAIVSNLAPPYGEEIMRMLGQYVDMLHYSYLEGRLKPDTNFFLTACHRLGCRPDEAMMIGDNYENDYVGATDAGLNATLIVRPRDTLSDLI